MSIRYKIALIKVVVTGLFVVVIFTASDYFSRQNSGQIKYFVPYVITTLLVTFLIYASLSYKIENYFILICAALPVLVWGSSVVIPFVSDTYWPLTVVLMLVFCMFRSVGVSERQGLSKGEMYFWSVLFIYYGGRCVVYTMESLLTSNFDFNIFVNWCLAPFLFCLFVWSLRKRKSQEEVGRIISIGLVFLFMMTMVIAVVEAVTRGQGFGLSFLLNGANGGYSSTEGDVTGGHGEPLVLGMSAAFGAIIAAYSRNYKFVVIMMLLAVFCMSLRPMLVIIVLGITLIFSTSGAKGLVKAVGGLFVGGMLLIIYKDVLLAKFLGVNSVSSTLDYGRGVSVGYNIVYYFQGLQWAKYVNLDITPWVQIFTAPLVGGNEGIPFFRAEFYVLPFFVGLFKIIISVFIIFQVFKMRQYKIMPALFLFFVLVCYLDPFQALYRASLEEVRLGSIPRESPAYFFILYIVAIFYLVQMRGGAFAGFRFKKIYSVLVDK